MPRYLILLTATVFLAACTDDEHYPVSGEECHEGDPVLEMTPPDCIALPTGTGTM